MLFARGDGVHPRADLGGELLDGLDVVVAEARHGLCFELGGRLA